MKTPYYVIGIALICYVLNIPPEGSAALILLGILGVGLEALFKMTDPE